MKVDKSSLLLYAVTDRNWLGDNSLSSCVEEAIKAGASFVQLREKELPNEDFLAEAKKIKEITDRYQVPFVINDNIEVALACDADGVHVGQDDMEASAVRTLLGKDKIIGVSVRTVEEAISAQQHGADYLGVGAMFSTSTKLDAADVTLETLKRICESVSIPVIAIGGINEKNLQQLEGSGIAGVAVVSAIFSKDNIYTATKELYALAQKLVNQ